MMNGFENPQTQQQSLAGHKVLSTVSVDFAEVFASVGEPFFLVDRDFRFSATNDAYRQLIGQQDHCLRGRLLQHIHPNARESSLLRALQAVFIQKKSLVVEDYDSELGAWLEYRLTPVGEHVAVMIIDVTDIKQSALNLAHLAEANTVLERAAVGIARISLDGRWLSANQCCCTILGHSEASLKHKLFSEVSLPEDAVSDQLYFAELLSSERKSFISERQIITAEGSLRWVHLKISLVRSRTGQSSCFILVLDDIGERKDAEESLQFALEAAKLGNWDFDALKNTTRRSIRFNQIFGYDFAKPAWGYDDFLNSFHFEDRKRMDSIFRQALSQGDAFSEQCRIVWPEGATRWVSLKGRVYMNREGRAIRMAGLAMDITREKIAEQEVQSARLAAEDANREKSNFLANMSHEIRTPLGAILGFTDIMRDPSSSSADQQKYLEIISRNGRNLTDLIDDILDLSKVEAGHLEIESASVCLSEVMDGITSLFKPKAESKNLRLEIIQESTLPIRIMSDLIRLRQILLNVIGNAIKFTDSGSVIVTLKMAQAEAAPTLLVTIKDTGVGMSESQLTRIFLPFTQADSSMTRKYGGTGLGLALSRRLARAMGGDLKLESTQSGCGSTFALTLPLIEANDSPTIYPRGGKKLGRQVGARRKELGLSGLRILVADDSPDNQFLIKRMLVKKGVEIDLASDGAMAVDMARADDYDMVLMDMQMPKLDGYEATRELRKSGFARPIVALTAHAMRHDREKCLEAGCSDYLSKPVDPDLLYRIVGELADRFRHPVC